VEKRRRGDERKERRGKAETRDADQPKMRLEGDRRRR
jgi:hypothetical protein